MVKFFCDRCGAEVENMDALWEFSINVTERPNRLVWNWRAEVCQDCYETLKDEIHNRVVSPPVVEETKKRNIRKAAS